MLAGPALRRRLLPTIATAAAIALFHALTIVSARFHIPIEPMMAIWAAAGLSRWTPGPAHRVGSARLPTTSNVSGSKAGLACSRSADAAESSRCVRPGLQERQDQAREPAPPALINTAQPQAMAGTGTSSSVLGRQLSVVTNGPEYGSHRDAGTDRGDAPRPGPAAQPREGLRAAHRLHPLEMLPLAPLVPMLQAPGRSGPAPGASGCRRWG